MQKTMMNEIEIALIRFPALEDVSDFPLFSSVSGVQLTWVKRAEELKRPDFMILPDTKDVMADLLWMRREGLEEAVISLTDQGVPVWGICGGYQMMGEILEVNDGAGGVPGQSLRGMGLLPLKTAAATAASAEKTRIEVEGAFSQVEGIFEELSGKSFFGREIHIGKTWINRENGPADTARFFGGRLEICRPLSYLLPLDSPSKRMHEEGWSRGNVYGCSIEGIFDQQEIVMAMMKALREEKIMDKTAE